MAPESLTKDQKVRAMACVIQQLVEVVFSTHIYEFGRQDLPPTRGGPIGLWAMAFLANKLEKLAEKT